MKDYYLSFESEAQSREVLWDGESPRYGSIDVIGLIYKPTGKVLETEEGEVPEMSPLPGWHVNVRVAEGEDTAPLEPFACAPKAPVRVWA